MQVYHEALPLNSPERLSENRQLNALMRILPWSIQERALWEVKQFTTAHQLKTWANEKFRATATWRGIGPKSAEIVAALEHDEDLRHEVSQLGDHASEDAVFAIMKRRPFVSRRPQADKKTSHDG